MVINLPPLLIFRKILLKVGEFLCFLDFFTFAAFTTFLRGHYVVGTSPCFSRAWYNLLHVHKIKMATAQNFISPNIAKYFSTFSRCIHMELFNPAYYSNSLLLTLSISSISQLSPLPLSNVYLGPQNMKMTTTCRVLNNIVVATAPKIFCPQENSQWGWHNTLMVFHRIGFLKYFHKYCSLIT